MTTNEAPPTDGWAVAEGPARSTPPPDLTPPGGGRWPRAAVLTTAVLTALLLAVGVFVAGFVLGRDEHDPEAAAEGTDDGSVAADGGATASTTDGQGDAAADGETEAAGDDTDAAAGGTADTDDATATDDAEEAVDDQATTPEEDADDGAGDTADDADTTRVQGADEEPVRTAVLSGGQVFLRGRVPSAAIAEAIAGRVAQVVGPDNVVVEYEVDPTAPVPPSAPLFVEDRVLFDSGSAVVREEFEPLLDLGVDLLTRFPEATLTVIGHTDPVGPADVNLELSLARVAAVTTYLTERGVPADQVLGQARGEDDLLTDDDSPAGRAANRRAEFVVNGLLDG